jgi:hypothetical protein
MTTTLVGIAALALAADFRAKFDTATATAWDYKAHGGLFTLDQASSAKAFFEQHGFVVIADVMDESENAAVKRALVADLSEINPSTRDLTDPADFDEADLPTSPNHSFRTTCNICFGRFASEIRAHEGVRAAFAALHGCAAEDMGVSWDTVFYTSRAREVSARDATQLHWDHNGYCAGEPHLLSKHLCVQGVFYASATDLTTPAFACSPGSNHLWRAYSDAEHNPARRGSRLLNYLPLEAFPDAFLEETGLEAPVRVHCPAGSLVLWDARTCHGNTPPVAPPSDGRGSDGIGRVSLAICYHPVEHRTAAVQKESLVKALGGVRTTHHPAVMLSHNKQGYPADWTAEAEHEPNPRVRSLRIPLNPDVSSDEFEAMLARAPMSGDERTKLRSLGMSTGSVQRLMYDSYWGREGLTEADVYEPMGRLHMSDLRRLVHPRYSCVQAVHSCEELGE